MFVYHRPGPQQSRGLSVSILTRLGDSLTDSFSMRITLGCWGLGLWALLGKYGTTTVCLECRLDLMSSLLPSFVLIGRSDISVGVGVRLHV